MSDDNEVPVRVRATKNGPLTITGPATLVGPDGEEWTDIPDGTNVALCRCGQSGKKPFCDGTHNKVGFEATQGPSEQPYPW